MAAGPTTPPLRVAACSSTYGAATLTDCTVSGNSASAFGGGLENVLGGVTLTGCTFSGNTSPEGGGLSNFGNTTLTDCTVSGNSARFGGGLYGAGTATLINCTVSGNSARDTGGLYAALDGGATTLTNTIIAGNSGGDFHGNLFYSGSNNLIGGNPLLAPLGNYGGPTQTMPPLPGSPAIGGGTATGAPATDQRGLIRGRVVDVGACQVTLAVKSAAAGTAFGNPLAVTVTANNTNQFTNPVDGGVIGFTVNPAANGASAALSADTATISGSQASVTATADTAAGNYTVTVSVSGVTTPANFNLTNNPGAAATITEVSGSGQSTTVAQSFANPLVALVTDTYGNPVPGVSVIFAEPGSGASASVTGSPATTGANGQASVTATANTVAGSYSVTASVSGVTSSAGFSLTNTPGAAATVAVVSGSGQSTTVAQSFANPLVVVVKDGYGNLVLPGTSTTFTAFFGANSARPR